MPSGGLYATYYLLGEPETTIDYKWLKISGYRTGGYFTLMGGSLPLHLEHLSFWAHLVVQLPPKKILTPPRFNSSPLKAIMGIEDDPTPLFGVPKFSGANCQTSQTELRNKMQHGNPYVSGIFRDPQ